MTQYVIKIDDVPSYYTVFEYVKSQTDIVEKYNEINKNKRFAVEKFSLNFSVSNLLNSALDAIKSYGLYGWLSNTGRSNDSYQSLSLVHNPYLKDRETNEYNSTLGSSLIEPDRFFYGTDETFKQMGDIKNTYYDSYGFCIPNAIMTSQFASLLLTFKRTQIRSRMSVIKAGAVDSLDPNYLLHKDEPVFENLRLNIPITSTDSHFLEIKNPDGSLTKTSMNVGMGYVWDTNQPHRVYGASTVDRINLVLGFSPWFDYVPQEKLWVSNQYYGNIHPIDMIGEGLVTSIIKDKIQKL